MKKTFFSLVAVLMAVSLQAQDKVTKAVLDKTISIVKEVLA